MVSAKGSAIGVSKRYVVCCFVALVLVFMGGRILNEYIFPLFDPIFSWARETSTGMDGLILIAVALLATWRPHTFKTNLFIATSVLLIAIGAPVLFLGLYLRSIVLLIIGSGFMSMGRGLVMVTVGVSCIDMGLRPASICITMSYLLAFLACIGLGMLPDIVGIVCFVVLPLMALATVFRYIRPIFDGLFSSEPPAQMAVTRPTSFLSFGHQFFVCLLLFRFVYGYALTFGEVKGVPLSAPYAVIPIALVALLVLVNRKRLNADLLLAVSALFVVAGFLVLSISAFASNTFLVNNLLYAGVGCFEIFTYYVLIALGSKNRSGALTVFAWGSAMNAFGVIFGANLGRYTNRYYGVDLTVVQVIAATTVFMFVAYLLLVVKDFSFKATVDAIIPAELVVTSTDVPFFERRCDEVAAQHALSAREREVFCLLARGRNSRFIQDELVVSYNTVKAHVRHIYTKLGVHTQQELINMVECDRR